MSVSQEKYITEERSIKFSVLRKLPSKPITLVRMMDMDGKEREAAVCIWRDYTPGAKGALRKAYFCLETAEYLSEGLPDIPPSVRNTIQPGFLTR